MRCVYLSRDYLFNAVGDFVAYGACTDWPSRSEWIVPGTYRGDL